MRSRKIVALLLILTLVTSMTLSSFAYKPKEPIVPQTTPIGTRTITKDKTVTGEDLYEIMQNEKVRKYAYRLSVGALFTTLGQTKALKILGFFGSNLIPDVSDIDSRIEDAYDDGTLQSIDSINITIKYRETYNRRNPSEVFDAAIISIRVEEN